MAEDVGGIVWTADINTSGLTSAERRVDRSTRNMTKDFERTEKSANRVGGAVRRMAAGISAALAVRQVTAYADAWTNVQNQLRVVTDGQEDLVKVSDHLVAITKDTRASLEGTATLYSRFRRGVDDTVISDERLLGVTKTINQALAVSGATAAESEGALRQLAQGLAAGALRGEEFNSVSEQAPGILRAVSMETGKTIGELREFAAEGGITSELLITALENYADTADKEFNSTTRTMSQSLQVARTNAIEFVGATQSITDAVGSAGDGVVFLSENLDSLMQIATVGVTIFGARFVGAMSSATAAYIANSAAAFDASTESQRAARAKLTEIAAEVEFLRVTQASLSSQLAANAATAKAGPLRAQLAANTTALTAATRSYAAAQATANGATAAGTAVMRGLRGVMGLLGGTGGVIFLAAAGLYAYATRAEEAKSANEILSQSTDDLTQAKARLAKLDTEQTLAAEEKRLADLERQIENSTSRWKEFGKGANENKAAQEDLGEEIRRMRAELASGEEDAEGLRERLGELADVIAGEASPEMDDLAGKSRDAGAAIRSVADEIAWAQEKVRAGVGGDEDPFDIPDNGGSGASEPDGPQDPGNIGLTSLQQLRENSQKEMQILQENYEAKELSELEFQERMAVLAQEYSNRRQEIMQGEKQGFMGALEEMGVSFESLQNQAVGALTSVATGMQSGSEAAKDLARAVLTQVIGAIVKMGIQSVATQLFATGASKAAATAAGAAWAAPAALASLATMGSNSVPAQAAIGTTVGMATALGAGGGRLYGGPVDSGNLYPVNEDGRPEMLTQNGRQYLLPGARGEVTSNKEMTQNNSGGNVTVNQTFQGGQGMDSQQLRNMVFDANVQDAIYSVMQRQNAKRGRKM